ncbi:MAG TPA: hypothetical protein VN948_14970 [Terriglobales bacterium]|nr:hypothetical protein [Terriglobales bacterium]
MKLIFTVALGYVLGRVLWEILGVAVDQAARVTGRAIALLQIMMQWQREIVAKRKADEGTREIVKGHLDIEVSSPL